ncbi:MAG: hypothetical protein O3A86_07030 [Bacteroidetes bacterium]|nr:hypothetical protein [Bacteroidota bacterium]
MKKMLFGAAILALMALAACEKDPSGTDIKGKTNQEVLMMQPWHLTSWTDSTESFPGVNQNIVEPCLKDDVYEFISTTQVKLTVNSVCDAETDNTLTWNMPDPKGTTVNFLNYTWNIETVAADKVTMSRDYLFNIDGVTYTIFEVLTLTK